MNKTIFAAFNLMLLLTLAACGGGGGGSAASGASSLISGTVATGAPLSNATITIMGANGVNVTVPAGSYDSTTGKFTNVDVSTLTAPYVIVAQGFNADTPVTLTSLQSTAASQTPNLNVNVTPITHAIAGAVLGHDPTQADPTNSADATAIANNLSAATSYIGQVLSTIATSAGVTNAASYDPIHSTFSADGTGADKILDNVTVNVTPDGSTSIYAAGSIQTNDLTLSNSSQPSSTQLASASAVSFNSSTNFNTTPSSTLNVSASALVDGTQFTTIASDFTSCFATIAASARSSSSACTQDFSSGYLNNGQTLSNEWGNTFSNSAMNNATFFVKILQQFSATSVKVRISYIRSDTVTGYFDTVATNSGSAQAPSWQLTGNQRPYYFYVNATGQRYAELDTGNNKPSYFATGLTLYFNSSIGSPQTNIKYVLVQGPGLPGYQSPSQLGTGVFLNYLTNCSYLVFAHSTSPYSPITGCTSFYRMSGHGTDSSFNANSAADTLFQSYFGNGSAPSLAFAPAKLTDTQLSAIQPSSAYVFTIVDNSNNSTYYVERLRGAVFTDAQLTQQNYISTTQTELTFLSTVGNATSTTGFTASWIAPDKSIIPTSNVNVQFKNKNNVSGTLTNMSQGVPRCVASSSVSTCSYTFQNPPANIYFDDGTAGNGYNFLEFITRTPSDQQIMSAYQYYGN